jgi:hypothetical protein
MGDQELMQQLLVLQVIDHHLPEAAAVGITKKVRVIVAEDPQSLGIISPDYGGLQRIMGQGLRLPLYVPEAEPIKMRVHNGQRAVVRQHVAPQKACFLQAYPMIFLQKPVQEVADKKMRWRIHDASPPVMLSL